VKAPFAAIPMLAFAAVFLVLPSSGAQATVHILRAGAGWKFDPAGAKLRAGQRVAFVNDTTVTHTATCDRCGWDTGDIQPGQTKFVTIEATGDDAYHCIYHGQSAKMTGTLTVT
jgi:plastocyanin